MNGDRLRHLHDGIQDYPSGDHPTISTLRSKRMSLVTCSTCRFATKSSAASWATTISITSSPSAPTATWVSTGSFSIPSRQSEHAANANHKSSEDRTHKILGVRPTEELSF